MDQLHFHTLANGIRIVHKGSESSAVAHCGLVLNIGSRDEDDHQQGLAHFWEHMVFKGTKKRKAFHILNRLDSVGGELNAYTTKEKIAFYATVLCQHYENAVELLTDITFESTFPQHQLEKERGVILEEMSMYLDSPEDSLHDEFDEVIFGNHPLGYNILGTAEHVKKFTRNDFFKFIEEHLDTEEIIFSSVGNIPFKKVVYFAEKYFGGIKSKKRTSARKPFNDYIRNDKKVLKPQNQALCAIGRTSYPINFENRLHLIMLNNLLGGPAMNSRLNLALRERKGYVYSVESSYTPYEDTGLLSISFGTEPRQLQKSMSLVWKELNHLKNIPLGINQMKSIREQLKGQIAMSEERNNSFMLMMARSLLDFGRIESVEEVFNKIDNITAQQLQDLAIEIFDPSTFSTLIYQPE